LTGAIEIVCSHGHFSIRKILHAFNFQGGFGLCAQIPEHVKNEIVYIDFNKVSQKILETKCDFFFLRLHNAYIIEVRRIYRVDTTYETKHHMKR
jgi:TRAP-type mannitol/chloroaromatic compound transport system permease small subunit